MNRLRCPHCGQDGISAIRKVFLGAAFPTRCTECRERVGVPFWSGLLVVPFLIAVWLAPSLEQDGARAFWVGAMGTFSWLVLWDCFVPLTKR